MDESDDARDVYREARIEVRMKEIRVRRAASLRRIKALFRAVTIFLASQRRAAEVSEPPFQTSDVGICTKQVLFSQQRSESRLEQRMYAPGGKGFDECRRSFETSAAA